MEINSNEDKLLPWVYPLHLEALSQALDDSIIKKADADRESFIVSQRALKSSVAIAISRMTARMAPGEKDLEKLVRRQEDLLHQLAAADKSMIQAFSDGKSEIAERHRTNMEHLREELSTTSSKIEKDFPDYAELSNPKPVSLEKTQHLLTADEALVTLILDREKSYLWAVRKNQARWWILPLQKKTVDEQVRQLRSALDLSAITNPDDIPNFPLATAQKLYQEILQPAEDVLEGAKRIFVVADGSLQSIPFGILINGHNKKTSYKGVNWLAREYAFAYLPSVSSLKALRTLGKHKTGRDPFLGFGDPVLGNREGTLRVASVFDKRGTGLADIRGIRQLASLPETAEELKALASTLNAPADSVYLRQQATESKLKKMDLSKANVLAFATHGLLAGDFEFLGEPALVMTPPATASREDDGLLTAGEVAGLKLNADWVVLSACNTAASDGTPGAEGFTGLTKAFFYAGAKTLLVSHWPVESGAAKQLTTSMFQNLKRNPTLGKAEALRQARLEMINNTQKPYLAHPTFWAPFVVVGEARTTM